MKNKIFIYELEARGYELDSFGHVNNSVYLNYFEQARWNIIRELGIIDFFETSGSIMVVVDLHIRYAREIKLFDALKVETTLTVSEPYLMFKHLLLAEKNGEKHANSLVKTLFLDNYRKPIDIPENVLIKLTHSE